ncbi:hypothetical protein [Lentzea sp. CA-135723]|uniref:hypothetical protein n=1 Tax=Lentzea sp. CA-135723 TaxID=3239950 RepID=UPI003D931FC5
MPDPFTLAAVSATALPHLVKFVFEQAGKVLDKRRSTAAVETTGAEEAQKLRELEQSAQVLRKYAVDGTQPQAADEELRNAVGTACRHIESLNGEPLDLVAGLRQRGVRVDFENNDITGTVTGIKATGIAGTAKVSVKLNDSTVRAGGEFTGIELNGPIG